MELTDNILDATARLAALDLTASERDRLRGELSRILGYVELLGRVDPNAADGDRGLGLTELRPDEPRPSLPREDALRAATATDGETFAVPPVLDNT